MYKPPRSKAPKSPSKARLTAGYIRVSTVEQSTEGVSLQAQEARIRAYCEATGRALSEVIVDEAQSAKTLVRTGLQGLFSDIRAERFGTIVVLKLDRLTRSVRDLADIIDFLEKHDCGLVSVSEHVDTATASGRLMLNLLASVSQWEREAIAERTSLALAHKRENGLVYGRTPFGFARDGERIVSTPAGRKAVRLIQKMHDDGATLRSIAATLNAHRIAPAQGGKTWYASSVRSVLLSRMQSDAGAQSTSRRTTETF